MCLHETISHTKKAQKQKKKTCYPLAINLHIMNGIDGYSVVNGGGGSDGKIFW